MGCHQIIMQQVLLLSNINLILAFIINIISQLIWHLNISPAFIVRTNTEVHWVLYITIDVYAAIMNNCLLVVCVAQWVEHMYIAVSINSTADDWPKVLSLRTLLVRSVQHLVTYTKMFVCMSSFRIRLMTSSLMSTNRVTALEPYIPIITDY